jgi:hypothetical protein
MITLFWLIIQLVLLKGIKMDDQHHYLVPGLLLVLLLSAFAIEHIRARSKKLQTGLIAFYILFAVWQGKNTFVNAGFYAAQTKSFYKMVDAIKKSNSGRVIYMTDKAIAGDWLMGTSAILRLHEIKAPLSFCSSIGFPTPWETKFLKSRPPLTFSKTSLSEIQPNPGDWIIFVESPVVRQDELAASSSPQTNSPYIERIFLTPYYNISINSLTEKSDLERSTGFSALQIQR